MNICIRVCIENKIIIHFQHTYYTRHEIKIQTDTTTALPNWSFFTHLSKVEQIIRNITLLRVFSPNGRWESNLSFSL